MTDQWIKDLKAGDKVYIKGGSALYSNALTITTVIKVTPKGHIRTKHGYLFRNGTYRVDSYNFMQLVQWTAGIEEALAADAHLKHMQYTINAVDMRNVDNDKVQAVYDILFTCDDK